MAQAEAVEIVNFQVTAVGLIPKPVMKTFDASVYARSPPEDPGQFLFQRDAMPAICRYFAAAPLQPGTRIEGPAMIEEKTSTTVLYPGQRAKVDDYLNIEVEVPGG